MVDFATMSSFGSTARGGVERQAASDADGETRAWFMEWLVARGFRVEIDMIGNIFGLLEWSPGAPYVLMGSHLDSQPLAGRYDGAYGVLAAAHAADRIHRSVLQKEEPLPFNLAVVDWFNEEGSRFKPSMMGSGVYTGKSGLDVALGTVDAAGVSVKSALDALGQRGSFVMTKPAAYAEIHIEQGRVLKREDAQIGVVEATWAANKYEVVVLGEQSHTGATVMEDRRDALYGAALTIAATRDLVDSFEEPLHTSCSELYVFPNSPVVVAREVRMHVDLRSPESEVLAQAGEVLRRAMADIEVKADVRIEARIAHQWDRMAYQPEGVRLARDAAEALGLSHRNIMTVAGHDSTNMKDIVPSVMLFVPSEDGISHNELEFTTDADVCAGVNHLTELAERLCRGGLGVVS
jgi:N-carbamoyl-L-amino-acid hydrolase